MTEETIVVVRRDRLPERAKFSGVRPGARPFLEALTRDWFPAPRTRAEDCPEWKQPIPYIVVRRGRSIFTTVRSDDGLERRLRNKTSIGIGGHLRPLEGESFEDLLLRNAHRELNEELVIEPALTLEELATRLQFLGVINDEGNEVGRCHLGFLYLLDLDPSTRVSVRETDKLRGSFLKLQDIPRGEATETWSQLALKLLEEPAPNAD
ncbi:MAG: hypothetical protein R6U92_07720 [Bacillota bacterium]